MTTYISHMGLAVGFRELYALAHHHLIIAISQMEVDRFIHPRRWIYHRRSPPRPRGSSNKVRYFYPVLTGNMKDAR